MARSTGARSTGRPLKTLPKTLRDHAEVNRLRQLTEWLDEHAADCLARVDTWMVSSLPIPTALLARVWPDSAWQDALRDLVVVGDDPDEPGFLRDATADGELRVVNLDGETVRLSPATVTLPHPVLLPDLDDLREFAVELGVKQRVEQLDRAIWARPTGLAAEAKKISDFAGAKLASRYAAGARAVSLGYQLSGSYLTCRVWEAGRTVEASVYLDGGYDRSEATMGDLIWRHPGVRQLSLVEVGPVAWSEGTRMAVALSGRQPGNSAEAPQAAPIEGGPQRSGESE